MKHNLFMSSLILMSPDPVTGNAPAEVDPLSVAAGEVDISYPLLPNSNYEMVVDKAEVVPTKDQSGNNFHIKWKTAKVQTSTKGEQLSAGQIAISQYIGITPGVNAKSGKERTAVMIAKDLARVIRATKCPSDLTARDLINNPTILAGKTAIAKVVIREERDEYPESNQIKSLVVEG